MSAALDRLVSIMDRLREPGGCPWDREMTPAKLRPYLIEEAYEVIDAIDSGDDAKLREELGDLLLQVVFHARIAKERNAFDIDGVADAISEKLVGRHPHVFGDLEVSGVEEVLVNWESLKKKERAANGAESYLLAGLPKSLPALLKVFRIAEKRERTDHPVPAREELRADLARALAEIDAAEADDAAFGAALLALALLAFRSGVDPENALRAHAEALARETRG